MNLEDTAVVITHRKWSKARFSCISTITFLMGEDDASAVAADAAARARVRMSSRVKIALAASRVKIEGPPWSNFWAKLPRERCKDYLQAPIARLICEVEVKQKNVPPVLPTGHKLVSVSPLPHHRNETVAGAAAAGEADHSADVMEQLSAESAAVHWKRSWASVNESDDTLTLASTKSHRGGGVVGHGGESGRRQGGLPHMAREALTPPHTCARSRSRPPALREHAMDDLGVHSRHVRGRTELPRRWLRSPCHAIEIE